MEGALGVDEVDEEAVKRRFQQLQESCLAKKQRVPANVLEVLTLPAELVEDLVASAPDMMEGDAANARMTLADVLKRAREEAEEAKVELGKITKVQEEMKRINLMQVDKLREERVGEIAAWKTAVLESQKTFGSEKKRR